MAEDWADANRTDLWEVEMVDPSNPGISRGELLEVSALSMTCGYYQDTRMTASVKTAGEDGFVENSCLRIWHAVPEWGYREPLFTGYVTGRPRTKSRGTTFTEYVLKSALYAMQGDLWEKPFAVGKGGTALAAMRSILSSARRPYRVLAGAPDYRFTASKAWEAGSSKLTTLFDLADLAGCRLSVDERGYATVGRYVAPSVPSSPDWVLDTDDPRAVTLSDDVTWDTTALDVPGRYIVTHKDGDEVTVGYADAATSLPSSAQQRGYVLAEALDVQELSGGAQGAAKLAAQYLAAAQGGEEEWGLSTLYFPCREGDRVLLRLWGEERKGFIKDADFDLLAGTVKLTVKGAV